MSDFEEYEYISPTDKPALLALSSMETLANLQTICLELGYKVHVASNHEDFTRRFNALNYQLVVVEEQFASASIETNETLRAIQLMPMQKRRHCVFVLLGEKWQTMNPLVAWQQSVHAVVGKADFSSIGQIITKVTSDNDIFLNTFREVSDAIAKGEIR